MKEGERREERGGRKEGMGEKERRGMKWRSEEETRKELKEQRGGAMWRKGDREGTREQHASHTRALFQRGEHLHRRQSSIPLLKHFFPGLGAQVQGYKLKHML